MMRLCALLLVFLCDAKPVSEREKLRREKRAQELRGAQALDQQRLEAPLAAGAAGAPLAAARASHANASLSPLAAAPLAAAPLTNATSTLPALDAAGGRPPAAWCALLATWCKTHSYGELGGHYAAPALVRYCEKHPKGVDPALGCGRRRRDRAMGRRTRAAGGAARRLRQGPAPLRARAQDRRDVRGEGLRRGSQNHAPTTGRTSPRASVVAVIRDPYDRALSWFRFCIAGFYGKLPHPTAHCAKARQFHADAKKEDPAAGEARCAAPWPSSGGSRWSTATPPTRTSGSRRPSRSTSRTRDGRVRHALVRFGAAADARLAVATIEETARELPVEDAAFEVEKPDPGDADEVAKFDQRDFLSCAVKGHAKQPHVVFGCLRGNVEVSACAWTLDGDGDDRALVVNLEKESSHPCWKKLMGDPIDYWAEDADLEAMGKLNVGDDAVWTTREEAAKIVDATPLPAE
ncbi:hypothetical protein JL722_14147 [Aureococcus anophagefferens]|nr:hypothetical protein JL722_14147 [Aureococcus anophagefferens]